jgi:predicted NUDIX family phosphoesterase
MEEDPSFKQLIPYMLFRWTDDGGTVHLFEYLRGSGQGERRLHAKRSVGIGGHISTLDAAAGQSESVAGVEPKASPQGAWGVAALHPSHPQLQHVYREGMRRELEEEVAIETPYCEQIAGLINDDETPVGRVHLGVVHLCDVERPQIRPREADILDGQFRPVRDILPRLNEFESWSDIAVRALFG